MNPTRDSWHFYPEEVPPSAGIYLVTVDLNIPGIPGRIKILSWTKNLSGVAEYEFAGRNQPGWYDYDVEWGYCEDTDVVAWQPLPQPAPLPQGTSQNQ